MAASKGNKNAIGNNGGRPPFYNNANQLQVEIDKYFNECPDRKEIVINTGIVKIPVYTICGLAYFLGFESRQSFYAYEDKIEFSYAIKRARLKIEANYEQNLQFNNAVGSIFALKNMNWHDKTELDHTTGGEKINISFSKRE